MKRKDFIKAGGLGLMSIPMFGSLKKLKAITDEFGYSTRMPVLFLGHGSPMNAIDDNEFVRGFKEQAKKLSKPNAIVVVSAHWETKGTWVTAMQNPRTIHDFGGFPAALYQEQYPAPGDPVLAKEIAQMVESDYKIGLDESWGLDHGSWTVVKHLFPAADVPVIQISIDYTKPPSYHYQLAQQLRALRNKGVLIVGSGNMVHNLRRIAWDKTEDYYGYDWAYEASDKMKHWIMTKNHEELINFNKQGKAFKLAIPTPEHYIPLLYVLGLQDPNDNTSLFNDQHIGGSLTMTSVKFG